MIIINLGPLVRESAPIREHHGHQLEGRGPPAGLWPSCAGKCAVHQREGGGPLVRESAPIREHHEHQLEGGGPPARECAHQGAS